MGATSKIDLVVTDLDGTLWDGQGRAHPETLAALDHLATAGLPVLAATARRPASALATMRENGFLLPAVLFDGSLGRDFVDGTTFHRVTFESDEAVQVLGVLLGQGLEPALNVDHQTHDFVIGEAPTTHPGHLAFNRERTRQLRLDMAVVDEPIFSFLIVGRPGEMLAPVLDRLRGLAEASVNHDLLYGNCTLSIRPRGVSKLSGAVAFCRERGLDPDKMLAIGDGENDVELLAGARISCVPEDGCAAALELATHHIGPASSGGWAGILELIG